ncbi:hypothetical protein J3F83DRAFT_749548 [Trichoderma novae-zelandiae]
MKSSAVILAACASLAAAMPSYRSGNWNSTVVNWNTTTAPTSWNSTAVANSTLPQNATGTESAAVAPSSAPYWGNATAVGAGNETWVNHNETRFSPNQTHLPVPLIRRFRPQRKMPSRAVLLGY